MKSSADNACCLHVSNTEVTIPCAVAPDAVRLPPHTLRLTTAGRIACSAAQLVAGNSGFVKNVNHDAKCRSK